MARTKSIKFPNSLTELENLFDKLQRALCNYVMVSPNLRIKGGSTDVLAESQAAIKYVVDGVLCTKATGDMPAFSGTVAADLFNVFVFSVNAAGTLANTMGTAAATLGGVVFPTLPEGSVILGYVIINPTGTGDFVGGTTELDDATVAPNAVFVNTPFPFIPGLANL